MKSNSVNGERFIALNCLTAFSEFFLQLNIDIFDRDNFLGNSIDGKS
ncbi:hypothetical protein SAMN05216365_11930 [Porphyromonadaceae bacterium NLAE-zl-C104]|nr:hypothetical protein SAMN05216331_13232 [Porphyromonadaceae bacterium KH3R12]SFS79122.1 hypothetical protein SAMN05216365_11930 [Porphyromonadaceae bacterium NLAE-zl-C104]